MKKTLTALIAVLTVGVTTFAHGGYKKPVFTESKKYETCNVEKAIPMTLELGKSEGSNLVYIEGWGRIFLRKTAYGYQDVNNNFNIQNKEDGKIKISANVTMADVHEMDPEKYGKGEFYHSLSGYLHSHVYPDFKAKTIKIGDKVYDVVESKNDKGYDRSVLYTEKKGRFTFLKLATTEYKKFKSPEMGEFKFVSEMCPIEK